MKENVESKFSHNNKVCILTGYYKGYYGKIRAYDIKSKKYEVIISVDDRDEIVSVAENDLRKVKSWFG